MSRGTHRVKSLTPTGLGASLHCGKAPKVPEDARDPIAAAKFTLDDVEHRAVQVDRALDQLQETIARLAPNDWASEQKSIKKLREVLGLLQTQGRQIAEGEREFHSV